MSAQSAEERARALATSKTLEKHGRLDQAVALLREHGFIDDAVRILSGQRRFAEGAQLVVEHLGVGPKAVASLDAEKKKWARLAAVCFARAGAVQEAVDWFVALKEFERAAELLEKSGDVTGAARLRGSAGMKSVPGMAPRPVQAASSGALNHEAARRLEEQGKLDLAFSAYVQLRRDADAGRVALALGRMSDAGQFYSQAGLVYEAGGAYAAFGDAALAVDNYVRVPRSDPRYRQACLNVIQLSNELSSVSLKMDNFLAQFIEPGPQDGKEFEAFYILAKVYEKHDLLENAKEVLQKILGRNPGYRDSAARLQALEGQTQLSSKQRERLLADEMAGDAALRKPLPDLPDFPALDAPLPPPPKPRAHAGPEENRVGMLQGAPSSVAASPEKVLARTVDADVESIARELVEPPPPIAATPSAVSRNTLFSTGDVLPVAPPPPAAPQVVASAPTLAPPPPEASASTASPQEKPLELAPGTLIAERYKLGAKLGEGGTAVVFRATDLELNEDVVLKFFHAQLDDQALARFRQELALSRQLAHPNIVRLYDLGMYRGRRFITMELLLGTDLKGKLGTKAFRPKQAMDVLIQTCAGLKAAHDKGIIHRDIKPDNIFVMDSGAVKVMDFGIAKAQAAKGVTVAGMIAGTPEYMAPEQINNFATVTGATDQYALGITAFEMFTGRLPFMHAELVPLLMMHVNEPPPPPRSINPTLPAALEAIVLRCLAKNPADRFPDCGALGKAFSELHAKMP